MTSAPSAAKSGVYRAPRDPAQMRTVFERAGAKWIAVDIAGMRGKKDLLDALARALEFPQHFGSNWDALADSLEDLSWLATDAIAVELLGADTYAASDRRAWRTALDILSRAATYWRNRERVFVVFVHGAVGLPAYDA